MQEAWQDALAELGFRCARGGDFRRNGFSLSLSERWCCLATAPRSSSWIGGLGRPGLWKLVPRGRRIQWVFELPLGVLDAVGESSWEEAGGSGAAPALRAAVAWALGTADGEWERGWQAPPRAELEGWLPAGALTVQCGRFARQGTLTTDGGRLALQFTILAHVPPDLAASRMAWLREILLDAQWRWRMVRLGLVENGGGAAVQAEVDLTGAPRAILGA